MKIAAAVVPALLAATSVVASPRYLGRRANPLSDLVQARQAKVHRDLVDVCASIDVTLSVPLVGEYPPMLDPVKTRCRSRDDVVLQMISSLWASWTCACACRSSPPSARSTPSPRTPSRSSAKPA